VQGVEVGVVGDIPLATAKKIAESIIPVSVINIKDDSQSSVRVK
jgi:sigma-E factor negative regulatory protein RseB